MYANDGFRELDRQECLRLLAEASVGRIVHTRRALPAVLPMNFSLDTETARTSVVVCTSAASELARAVDGSVVAFETDQVDAREHAGWSVVVTGRATVVTESAEHTRLRRSGPRPWAPSPYEVFIRIDTELVTGRELVGGRSLYRVDLSC
ncbi:pyridoxamine 5'-phosphate oxidase family protein [Streptomyces tauricus]|uniref:pyridoxamine 5'-phosphate oxidase family protein n=1 Tax=Streptomyces tauricus TaxID=68274 RepID=UPI00387F16A0